MVEKKDTMKDNMNGLDVIKLCGDVFGLPFPPDGQTLKSTYRELVKKHHPDHGGNAHDFIRIKDAYEVLKDMTIDGEQKSTEPRYVGLRSYDDLGRGFSPPMPRCDKCEHRGWILVEVQVPYQQKTCSNKACRGGFVVDIECKSCHGTGRFVQKHGSEVDCRTCRGTGIYRQRTFGLPRLCGHCFGRGTETITRAETRKHLCPDCGGDGEIWISNPVLRINSMR